MPIGRAELALHDGGGGRKGQVGRGGGDDDQVDVVAACGRRAASACARRPRRPGRRSAGPSRDLVALADAGALDDPVVGGVDELGEVVVGDDRARQIAADAGDDAAQHWSSRPGSLRRLAARLLSARAAVEPSSGCGRSRRRSRSPPGRPPGGWRWRSRARRRRRGSSPRCRSGPERRRRRRAGAGRAQLAAAPGGPAARPAVASGPEVEARRAARCG